MIDGLYYFRDINIVSVFVRMLMAVLCSGLIGIEREYKRRPAGFRTHILICLGACVTSLTGQYLSINLHYNTDMSRLGAQVIAGIGFIGAGAIILTPKNQVRGLTTSAGLWTCAIIGLCLGGGFFEGAILATILILFSEIFLSKFEYKLKKSMPHKIIYVEYTDNHAFDEVFSLLRKNNIMIEDVKFTRADKEDGNLRSAVIYLHFNIRNIDLSNGELLIYHLKEIEGIESVEII